jgi:hypothetical protein
VTSIVCKPKDVSLSQMSFCQETYIDSVLAEEMFQFQLVPRTPSAFQKANRRAFTTFVFLGRAAIFGYKEDNDFEDGRVGAAVRSRRVSSTQAPRG